MNSFFSEYDRFQSLAIKSLAKATVFNEESKQQLCLFVMNFVAKLKLNKTEMLSDGQIEMALDKLATVLMVPNLYKYNFLCYAVGHLPEILRTKLVSDMEDALAERIIANGYTRGDLEADLLAMNDPNQKGTPEYRATHDFLVRKVVPLLPGFQNQRVIDG